MCGRAQPTTDSNPTTTRLPRVVIDPTVRLDEALDTRGVEVLERLEPCPRGEGDPALHRRVRREDDVTVVAAHDASQFFGELGTVAVVLDHHAAILEVVNLQLVLDRL